MSTIRKRFLLPLTVLLLVTAGCADDLLQTEPEGNLSEATFWQTEEDARLAVNDLYNYLNGIAVVTWDAMSDIATANKAYTNVAPYIRSIQDAQTGWGNGQWNRGYSGIRAVNDFLANVEGVETENQQLIDRYKAEARFIRAYHYMYLAFLFGDVPLITEPITIEEAENVSRTDREEVWDFIAGELQEISEILPLSYDSDNQGRITKGAALALKARSMLYAGRYAEAYQAAEAVMDLGEYSLYPSYEDLFSYEAEHNQEVILNKEFIQDLNSNSVFAVVAPYSQQQAPYPPTVRYVPTKKIVDAYEMANGLPIDDPNSGYDPRTPYENRDPRLGYSIFVYGDTLPDERIYDPRPGFGGADEISKSQHTTKTGFNIQKYVNPRDVSQPRNNGINIILIRYAEVLLTYAEAAVETGNIDQSVYDAINQVRQRPDVDMPPIEPSKSQGELRQIVRRERMVELAFEGQRFFDIRRWRIAENVMNEPIYGMTYEDENGDLQTVEFEPFQREFTQQDYLWPLPQQEIVLTGMEQNPGY